MAHCAAGRGPGRRRRRAVKVFGYRVPAPNEALLISGRKQRGADALPFKIVTGHGVFVAPIFSKASRLTLAMQEAEVLEDCYTKQGLTLAVHAVIAFKVGDDHESIAAAARRFQGDQSPDADAGRPHLQRPPAQHHRQHDRRGDHPRAADAGRRDRRRQQDRDGPDRPGRRLAADQQHRRQGRRLHQGAGRAAPGPGQPGREGRPGGGRPAERDGPAGERALPGRVRPADRDRPGPVPGRDRPGPADRRPGRPARRRPGPAGACWPSGRSWRRRTPSCARPS